MKQLTNDEMRQVLSDWIDDTDASAKTRRNILGLFEAVIIRAEAAEAERDALRAQVGGQGWRPIYRIFRS